MGEIGKWVTVPGFTFAGEHFLRKFDWIDNGLYSAYFGLPPVEADHLGNLKAQLDSLRRDLARCSQCR